MQISIRKKPSGNGIAYCRRANVRERVLGWLLGKKKLVTTIVPNNENKHLHHYFQSSTQANPLTPCAPCPRKPRRAL
ncbi:MAG: hypothetical protein FWG82_02815 [Oscillospiraceae bacterium]|nr:hypothetical protein [Oscillospiraceae bacterium]